MKRKAAMVMAALVMASGVGMMGASQASARDCQYNTRSCKWEPTAALCLANADTINLPQYKRLKLTDLPQPFKGRFMACSSGTWTKGRG
ncbi:hypothetical protein [Streptomyces sp. NPDC054849]